MNSLLEKFPSASSTNPNLSRPDTSWNWWGLSANPGITWDNMGEY